MFEVSVAIPAWNEGVRLPPFLEALATQLLSLQAPATELLVCDDGSAPVHAEQMARACEEANGRLAKSPHAIRYQKAEKNGGKGAAIRMGWEHSAPEARWLGFLDADGAVSATEFVRLLGMLTTDAPFDALAGSRVKMAGHHVERSFFRHLQGRVFATLSENLLGLGFYDTQCGVKLFRAKLLRPLLPKLRETRWLLDLEVLGLLKQAGARFREEGIDWADPGDSKVKVGSDAVKMFLGLSRIKKRHGL